MTNLRALTAVVLLATTGCLGAAEESGPPTPTAPAQDGLTILKADSKEGVVGFYREGKRVVMFETTRVIVATPDPNWTLFDDTGVAVDISARITDAEGRGLYTTLGMGAPNGWVKDEGEETADFHPPREWFVERRELFKVAVRAGEALAKVALPSRLEPERDTLLQIAGALAFDPAAAATDVPVLEGESAQAITGYREYFEIRASGPGNAHECTRWQYQHYDGGWWGMGWIDNRDHGSSACVTDAALNCARNTATRGSTSTYRNSTRWCDTGWAGLTSAGYSTGCQNVTNCNHPQTSTYSNYCMGGLAWNCHNCRTDTQVQREWVQNRTDIRTSVCNGARLEWVGCL